MNRSILTTCAVVWLLSGCNGGSDTSTSSERSRDLSEELSVGFRAKSFDVDVSCEDWLAGYGPDGTHRIGVNDLRFFVSNIRFFNESNEEIPISLDINDFQYEDDSGSVALIDLTDNSTGTCANGALAFGEGTDRTNSVVTGKIASDSIARISFDVGVPQALMKSIIATNTAEDAPSPLGELYWSWASGYRHFVINFAVEDAGGESGEGYLHVGSRGCGGSGLLALEGKEQCDLVNTPRVVLDGFDPETNVITVDLSQLLSSLSMISPIYDTAHPHDILGEGPGVSCHSSATQADCESIFSNFGVSLDTGVSDSETNQVFGYE